MSATADSVSDALVALLAAAMPQGGQVFDHDPLPIKAEDLPTAGLLGVFLFEDQPTGEDGTDTAGKHDRQATFKVEGRATKARHMLHGSQALRRLLQTALHADPTLGGLVRDCRPGPMHILVHESNNTIACFSQDVLVDYLFDPETP